MKKNNLNISVIGLGSIGARHAKSLISLKKKLNIKDIKCFDTNIKRAEKFSLKVRNYHYLEFRHKF